MIENNKIYNHDAKDFIHMLYEDYGDNSINMFFCDFPYTFKGKQRVTANKWDLPIDDKDFFDVAMRLLTEDGVICLTASQPFTSYLVYNHLDCFKYEWVIEKDNGSNFMHVKHQPFKVHESVLIFGKSPTTYNKNEKYMKYNPQMTVGKAYKVNRKGMTDNLATSSNYERTSGEYGEERYPRSVLKFNWEKGLHPTQKPVDLVKYMINTYTDEGATVVDVCCGSGTTAIASILTNRKFIVNDIEEKYYEIAKNRIEETLKNQCL